MKNKQYKLITVVGTRPELIRLSETIKKLDIFFDHHLVHSGQNYDYDLNKIFFDDLDIREPDFYLDSAKETPIQTIADLMVKIESVINKIKPDAFLVLGDTNSCLSVLSAKRYKIPIFHIEAGNRCFDQRVPEEINRKLVDHIADINICYSKISREYLLAEGLPKNTIFKVGSPLKEILDKNAESIKNSKILIDLNLKKNKYFLVSCHREENVNSIIFDDFVNMINFLDINYQLPIIISTHPRTRNMIKNRKITFSNNVKLLNPLGFFDYNKLQINALITLSDSGSITEESSILNFPALNIRNSNERPEGFEQGSVPMVCMNINIISKFIDNINFYKNRIIVDDYDTLKFSDKVVSIILSHIDFVNDNVWKK